MRTTPKLSGSRLVTVEFLKPSSIARLRHVKVDPGFHTIDRQAWRRCHSLQIVKLPDTVVAIEYAAFQVCCTLVMVEMPGCVELRVRLFSECCALEKVGIIIEGACRLAIGAVVRMLLKSVPSLASSHCPMSEQGQMWSCRRPPRQESHKAVSTRLASNTGRTVWGCDFHRPPGL